MNTIRQVEAGVAADSLQHKLAVSTSRRIIHNTLNWNRGRHTARL